MGSKLKKLLLGSSAMVAIACGGYAIGSKLQIFDDIDKIEATGRWKKRIEASNYMVPSRASQLSNLRESSPSSPLDLLIIGGGATGCGCALDGSTRGLKVGLVERDDFSSGTSSRSTKLVHGGKIFYVLSLFTVFLLFWFDLRRMLLRYERNRVCVRVYVYVYVCIYIDR